MINLTTIVDYLIILYIIILNRIKYYTYIYKKKLYTLYDFYSPHDLKIKGKYK